MAYRSIDTEDEAAKLSSSFRHEGQLVEGN